MDNIGPQLLLQLVLILLNAFFAATEIAVISLNAGKLKKMVEDGDKKAGRILRMVEQPAGFLSTIQIGITLAGFLGSAFAADNFAEPLVHWLVYDLGFSALPIGTLRTLAVILITLILSYFTLILGELVPKRIAMQKPLQMARFSASIITGLSVVMKPIIWFLSVSTNGVLRLLRLKTETEEDAVTEEEIRLMVDIGEEKGTIEPEERELIDNIFEFSNSSAKDVMTHRIDVEAIALKDTDEQILALIRSTGLSRFPVYDQDIDNVVGVLSAREYLLNREEAQPAPLTALLRPAFFIPETLHTDVLFRDMQQKKVHFAVVVGEYGETAGIVTLEDLLEEIVGNIYDEFDPQEEQEVQPLGEGAWRMAGSVDLDTVAETLEIELPEELNCDTLGGLVLSLLESFPEDGATPTVEGYGLQMTVERLVDRRIEWVLIRRALRA